MSYHDQLMDEIERELDTLIAKGDSLKAQWVAHAICTRHRPGLNEYESDHWPFWEHGGYAETRKQVTRAINRRAGTYSDPTKAKTSAGAAGLRTPAGLLHRRARGR